MGQIVNIHRVGSCDFWKLYNSQLKAGSHLNIKYHNSATEKCALTWAAAIIYEQVRLDKLHESALQVHDKYFVFFFILVEDTALFKTSDCQFNRYTITHNLSLLIRSY